MGKKFLKIVPTVYTDPKKEETINWKIGLVAMYILVKDGISNQNRFSVVCCTVVTCHRLIIQKWHYSFLANISLPLKILQIWHLQVFFSQHLSSTKTLGGWQVRDYKLFPIINEGTSAPIIWLKKRRRSKQTWYFWR